MLESEVDALKRRHFVDADEILTRPRRHFASPDRWCLSVRRRSSMRQTTTGCRDSTIAFAISFYILLNFNLVRGFGVAGSHRSFQPGVSYPTRQWNVAVSVASKLSVQSAIASPLCDGNAEGEDREGLESDDEGPYAEEASGDSSAPVISEAERRIARARASRALVRQRQSRVAGKSTPSNPRPTSVGDRRVGSATLTRQGTRATTQIVDALRKTARGALSHTRDKENDTDTDDASAVNPSKPRMLSITTSVIQAAVESLLRGTTMPRSVNIAARTSSVTGVDVVSAAFSSFESAYVSVGPEFSLLNPGSVLLPASNQDRTAVYVSTSRDDYSIATLRLSVFSDFSPEMQSQFHARSCQAMQSRRLRGAICLVAKTAGSSTNALLGSAECSFHEFFGTRLGQKRPRNSILYVTEVAVNASARRRGVGLKLLQAVDRLAKLRGTETVYLHVETMNRAAIRLYEKAGYRQAIHDGQHPEKVSLFTEFTRSLNLHPGATQGRDHFLFYKDLVPKPTWLRNDEAVAKEAQHSRHQAPVGVLGFEIPA